MTSEEHAEALIGYFSMVERENPGTRIWQLGQRTAETWLELIKSENISPNEVAELLSVAKEHKFEGSGWYDLALGIYHWAKKEGFEVPSYESFFSQSEEQNNLDDIQE
jgi:hypothetical protein